MITGLDRLESLMRALKLSAAVAIVVGVGLATPSVAAADAPATGTIVEGVSVGGARLGDTLAQVRTALGPETRCTAPSTSTTSCDWTVSGDTGRISVRFGYTTTRVKRGTPQVARDISVTSPGYATARGVRVGSQPHEVSNAYAGQLQTCGAVRCVFLNGRPTRFFETQYGGLLIGPVTSISVSDSL